MNNIDVYYESLKQVYEQIVDWPEDKPPFYEKITDIVMGFFGVILALSFIPILPAILAGVGGKYHWIIGPLSLSGANVGAFLIVWAIAFVGSLLIFLLTYLINNKVDSLRKQPEGPPQTLSPEQLTFVAIYEAYKELKVFFVSHVEQHVNNSLKALARALTSNINPREYALYREYSERELMLEQNSSMSTIN